MSSSPALIRGLLPEDPFLETYLVRPGGAVVLLVLNRDLGFRALTPHLVLVPGYAVVGLVATGLVPYAQLKGSDPLARAFEVADVRLHRAHGQVHAVHGLHAADHRVDDGRHPDREDGQRQRDEQEVVVEKARLAGDERLEPRPIARVYDPLGDDAFDQGPRSYTYERRQREPRQDGKPDVEPDLRNPLDPGPEELEACRRAVEFIDTPARLFLEASLPDFHGRSRP